MFKYLNIDFAETIVKYQYYFPDAMQENDLEVWKDRLISTPYSIGWFNSKTDKPMGWRIFQRILTKVIFVSELLVLPKYRGRGIATSLIKESLILPRKNGETIHTMLRTDAYRIVANNELLNECGYKIIKNDHQPNGYFIRYGVHEDAYELIIEPHGE